MIENLGIKNLPGLLKMLTDILLQINAKMTWYGVIFETSKNSFRINHL